MTDAPPAPAPAAPVAPVVAAPVAPQPAAPAVPVVPAAAAPAQPAVPATPATEKVEDLPAWAQKIITDARKEAGDNRVAKNAETERVNAILKAAGIQTDAPDPVAIAQKATDTANAAVRKLAVFEAAAAAGADPTKLLNRNDFTTSISGLDPADGAAIAAAITAAVAADPSLKTVRAAGASSVETPGGTGEQGQITAAQIKNMTPEQIVEADNKGLLRNYLAS